MCAVSLSRPLPVSATFISCRGGASGLSVLSHHGAMEGARLSGFSSSSDYFLHRAPDGGFIFPAGHWACFVQKVWFREIFPIGAPEDVA